MAEIYSIKQAVHAIKNGDKTAITDFGKRFPLATLAMIKAIHGDITDLVDGLPENLTVRKLDAALKSMDDTDEDEEVAEKPKKAPAPKKEAEEAPKKRGRKAKAKEVEEEDEEEEADNKYSSMTAPELFKLCKKRGLTAQPQRKQSYYIEILEAADNVSDEEDEDDSDDTWDEAEEEVKTTKEKKAKEKAKKAPAKKSAPAKKEEDEEDEDDDWNI